MSKITCKNCGWFWDSVDGGDDKYKCHVCGGDNSKFYLGESEDIGKKIFIPRRLDARYNDLVKEMITSDSGIEQYLKRRDMYKDFAKLIDPIVERLSKEDLIQFVKANPFWLNSENKIKFLFEELSYVENKDISKNHIGVVLSKGRGFFTTNELKYYEGKLNMGKNPHKGFDIYVFIGGDEFVKGSDGKYDKKLYIERLLKVGGYSWNDTSDYDLGDVLKMLRIRAMNNNMQLYKITANKGLLTKYNGKTGDKIPDIILAAINEKKERI